MENNWIENFDLIDFLRVFLDFSCELAKYRYRYLINFFVEMSIFCFRNGGFFMFTKNALNAYKIIFDRSVRKYVVDNMQDLCLSGFLIKKSKPDLEVIAKSELDPDPEQTFLYPQSYSYS